MQKNGTAVLAVVLLAGGVLAQPAKRQEIDLQSAIRTETVDGDLKGAIKQYEAIVSKFGKTDHSVAARAVMRIGQCYEKLGDAEARKAYERVVREYGDQTAAVTEARKHLGAKSGAGEGGVVAREASAHLNDRWFGPALSRDGRYIAFTLRNRVGTYEFATGEIRTFEPQGPPEMRVWNALISPDGKSIAFGSGSGQADGVYLIGADGTNARRIAAVHEPATWSWSPDGKQLLVGVEPDATSAKPAMMSVTDGSYRVIASGIEDGRISPDGRYAALVRGGAQSGDVVLVRVEDGKETGSIRGRYFYPAWSPDGKRLLLVSNRNQKPDLWSVHIENGAPAGPIEFVQSNVPLLLAATPNGDYYYDVRTQITDLYVADIDPQNGILRSPPKQITTRGYNPGGAWSPDGETLAYYSWLDKGYSVSVRSAKSGEVREIPIKGPLSPRTLRPIWLPDNRTILAYTWDGKVRRLDVQAGELGVLPDAAAIPVFRDGTNSPGGGMPIQLAPDGRTIYYLARDQQAGATRILRRALEGGPETEVCRATPTIHMFSISPDGTRLSYAIPGPGASPQGTVWTVPATGGEPKLFYRVTDAWPHHPIWSKDGRWLYVVFNWDGGDVYRFPAEGGEPKALGFGLHQKSGLDLNPDGSQMVFTDEQWSNHLWVLKNLFPDAKPSAIR